MIKKCLILFLSVSLLSLFTTTTIADGIKDDLSVKIDKYVIPESIWLDEPIIATCTYTFDLKGTTKVAPHENFINVSFLYAIERVPTGLGGQFLDEYEATNESEIPNYPEETDHEIRQSVRIDTTNGSTPNQVISGSFQLVYYPRITGKYKIICKAFNSMLKQSNRENDRDELEFTMQGTLPLTVQDIPVPTILKPGRKVVSISPYTESIELEGMIDPKTGFAGAIWHNPETLSIVFEEKWNFRLEKRIRTVGKQFETLKSYSGLFKTKNYGPIYFRTKITKDTLDKMGAGEYRLISWLSQEKTPNGTTKGLTTTFDFTVVREGHDQFDSDVAMEKSDKNDGIVIPSRPLENKNQQSTSTNKDQNLKVYMPKAVLKDNAQQGNEAVKQKDIFHGTDLFGMDYRHFTTEEWNVCNNACKEDNKCSSWTWVKPGIKGPQGFCFLKNGIPDKSLNDCCVSGIKYQSIK